LWRKAVLTKRCVGKTRKKGAFFNAQTVSRLCVRVWRLVGHNSRFDFKSSSPRASRTRPRAAHGHATHALDAASMSTIATASHSARFRVAARGFAPRRGPAGAASALRGNERSAFLGGVGAARLGAARAVRHPTPSHPVHRDGIPRIRRRRAVSPPRPPGRPRARTRRPRSIRSPAHPRANNGARALFPPIRRLFLPAVKSRARRVRVLEWEKKNLTECPTPSLPRP
jgi:hypothetical protein